MPEEQLSLFNLPTGAQPETPEPEKTIDLSQANALTRRTRLSTAVDAYRDHMIARRFSENTVKSFTYDLNLVAEFFTASKPIGEIAHRDLEKFVDWLVAFPDVHQGDVIRALGLLRERGRVRMDTDGRHWPKA